MTDPLGDRKILGDVKKKSEGLVREKNGIRLPPIAEHDRRCLNTFSTEPGNMTREMLARVAHRVGPNSRAVHVHVHKCTGGASSVKRVGVDEIGIW